jgi:hypothetical protein
MTCRRRIEDVCVDRRSRTIYREEKKRAKEKDERERKRKTRENERERVYHT